jgi:hypothetical protein
MMRPRRCPEDDLAFMERRHDHRQIGQVRSSSGRVVRQQDIAFLDRILEQVGLIPDRMGHRAEVNRDMRRIGHEPSIRRKDGA